jgi:hypothetical protein
MASAAKWAWLNSRAQNSSLLVLMAIAFEIDDKGNCVLSIAELAQRSHLKSRTVPGAVADLVRLGEVRVLPKSGDRGRNGYELCSAGHARSYAKSAQQDNDSYAKSAQQSYAESAQDKPGKLKVVADQDASYAESAQQPIPDAFDLGSVVTGKRSKSREVSGTPRPDVDRLCEHLADRIEKHGSKRPAIGKRWHDAARLLIDNDGRTEEQVHAAIDWCQDHHFWHRNILSMEKLREKYDRLALDAKAERNGSRPQSDNLGVIQRLAARAAMEDRN